MTNALTNQEIAKTIIDQIKAFDKWALMGWGAKNYLCVKNGLAFQINTPKLSNGWVNIELDLALDLYNLSFYNNRKKKVSEVKGVFFDELVRTIDLHIEKEDYQKRIVY